MISSKWKIISEVKQVIIFGWKLLFFLSNNIQTAREANCESRPLWGLCVVSLSHWVVSYIDMLLCLISWHAWYLFISMHNYPSQSVMPDFVWRRLIKCRLITSLWFLFSSPVWGVGSAGNVPQPGMTQNHDLLVVGLDKNRDVFVKIRVLTCPFSVTDYKKHAKKQCDSK